MRLVFDLEANGLYEEADTIWCLCFKDLDTGEKSEWRYDKVSIGLGWYGWDWKADLSLWLTDTFAVDLTELVGHNIINFDLPLLKKLTGWEPNESTKITDTLVMSRLANPDRTKPANPSCKSRPHTLESWGYRVGKGKPDHKDWSVFSAAMLRRCREDVEINYLVYYAVSSELKEFPDESIDLEHTIARIISDQEHHGIRFDVERAKRYIDDLTRRIEEIDREIGPELPKELEVIGTTVTEPFLLKGGYRKQTRDYLESAYGHTSGRIIGGPYTRIELHDFDLGSVSKVKEYLLEVGWIPDSWNYSKKTGERTSPKLEGQFDGIVGEVPKRVKERITWRHRRSQIEGWLKNVIKRDDIDVLPAGANPCGTNTNRFRHNTVVNIPKANTDKKTGELIWLPEHQKDIYGTQMRSLFIPREGYVIVGHDASGLELRMLAHYMDDAEFIQEILNGDIHTFNQERAGLPTRDAAKTFIYALVYGAGDAKIGALVGGGAEEGRQIKAKYFKDLPALGKLIERVKRASGKGYLLGLDKRRIYMRRGEDGRIMRNKALNTLLQSAGAVVMKRSCAILWDGIKSRQIEAYKVLDMHDEGQSEVLNNPRNIELYCDAAVNSIREAGKYYNLNIPLDAEAKVGMSLAETH